MNLAADHAWSGFPRAPALWAARCCLVLCAGLAAAASGQELEPRAYSASPVDTTFLVAAYGNTNGDVVFDASSAFQDVRASVNMLTIAGGKVLSVAGHQSSVVLALPFVSAGVAGNVGEERRARTVNGLADPRLRLSLLLAGGPALDRSEFAARPRGPIIGTSLLVVAPYGQYDRSKLVNIGVNRWAFKPEIGVSMPVDAWQLEAYAGVWLFGDNDDFLGQQRRTQAPMWSYQAHIVYNVHPGMWMAADATYYTGGATTVDGVRQPDHQDNVRLGLTFSMPIAAAQSLKFFISNGAVTRAGGDFRSIGMAWQYVGFR